MAQLAALAGHIIRTWQRLLCKPLAYGLSLMATSFPAPPQALLCGPLLQPLAIMCSDIMEACRLGALQLLSAAIPQLNDPAPLLPVLLPVLLSRIGHHPVLEEAEELRLIMVQLLAGLIGQLQTR